MLFILFDIGPCSAAFLEMMIFIAIVAMGLVYVWRKGALDWD
jgi:NADH:ubiquinone oxidoreductase subunit 3 (subunit A)